MAGHSQNTGLLTAAQFEAQLRQALAENPTELAALSQHFAFPGWTWLWGPVLYARDKIRYRPLMLSRFSHLIWTKGWYWKPVPWNPALEEWLQAVEGDQDLELGRRLWTWKLLSQAKFRPRKLGKLAQAQIRRRLHPGLSPQQIRRELDLWWGHGVLDEDLALWLWQLSPASEDYIQAHLPGGSPQFWQRMFQATLPTRPELAWRIYRRLANKERWERDIVELAHREIDPQRLCQQLERQTPDYGVDISGGLVKLLELRGSAVFSFVLGKLTRVWKPLWMKGNAGRLVDLCAERGWWELWGACVRIYGSEKDFNRHLRRCLQPQEQHKLIHLAGLSRQWDFGPFGLAQVQLLDCSTALALLNYDPQLLNDRFKSNLQVCSSGYLPLLQQLVHTGQDDLVDFLASRYLVLSRPCPEQDYLADLYLGLKPLGQFPARAANALTKLPAYSLGHYQHLMQHNRLTRLLLQRSVSDYATCPRALADLLEASEVHVMALGYRCLAQASPEQAAQHLGLLQACLLRPLQRQTRQWAFQALTQAARWSPEAAASILKKARAALRLPQRHYPKDSLLQLLGTILHLYPQLRSANEQRPVFGRV